MKDIVDQLIDLAHAISLGHDEDGDEGVHRAAAAEITRLRALVTPRPIETAPEVEDVLVWDGESWCMGLFGLCYYTQNYRWLVDGYQSENPLDYYQPCEPTYWLPLPPAPIKETK